MNASVAHAYHCLELLRRHVEMMEPIMDRIAEMEDADPEGMRSVKLSDARRSH